MKTFLNIIIIGINIAILAMLYKLIQLDAEEE